MKGELTIEKLEEGFKIKIDQAGSYTASGPADMGVSDTDKLRVLEVVAEFIGVKEPVDCAKPENPLDGCNWYDSTTGKTYKFMNDVWVQIVSGERERGRGANG